MMSKGVSALPRKSSTALLRSLASRCPVPAIVARIHHCYADGIALVQVLLSLTDTARKPGKDKDLARAWLKRHGAGLHWYGRSSR